MLDSYAPGLASHETTVSLLDLLFANGAHLGPMRAIGRVPA